MLRKYFMRFYKSEEGSILVTWAILLPVVTGMIGLGLETGNWYLTKRNLQAAADAAAIAGAYESTTDKRTSVATNTLPNNGFGNNSGVTITVNNPPLTGSYTTSADAVEVILSQPQLPLFSSLFLSTNPTITVRAVALPKTSPPNLGSGCALALDPSGSSDFETIGSATITAKSCFIASNSTSNQAINAAGNSSMTVQGLYTMGNYTGASHITSTDAPVIHATAPIPDPYHGLPIPSFSGCAHNSSTSGGTTTLSPGVYCGGLSLNGGTTVMQPGVYIMDQGSFSVNGNATLSGSGVTIILTSSTSANYPTVTINGGANVTLSAPTSGDYSGVAFFQDNNAALNNGNKFNGGSNMNITGALYMPSADITFNGGNSINTPCMQVIGWKLDFSGNNSTSIKGGPDCANAGMTPITTPVSGTVILTE